MIQLLRDPSYDFIGKRHWAYLASVTFILVSLASIITKGGLRYGIDFAGGTLVQLRFDEPTSIERIRNALDRLGVFGGKVLEDFAFVLTVGVVTGTYSTVYIAGGLIVDWTAWREGRVGPHQRGKARAKPTMTGAPAGRRGSRLPGEKGHGG